MPCYHPLKRFPIFVDNYITKYAKIVSSDVDHIENINGNLVASTSDVISPDCIYAYCNFNYIACGQCIGCRLDYSRQWANRCLLEMQYHEQSYFLTLTYDEDHLPLSRDSGFPTLEHDAIHDFMDRLNHKYKYYTGKSLRYFGCGEYGGKTYRPHYHIIVFGLKLDDLVLYKKTRRGDLMYNSEFVSSCWPYGFVTVEDACWETAAYTARYVLKKHKGKDKSYYDILSIEPEHIRMSRRPGIGYQYFKDNFPKLKEKEHKFIHVKTLDGGKKFLKPKYFQKLYEIEYPLDSVFRSLDRQKEAEFISKMKMLKTDLSYDELLLAEENEVNARIKSMKIRDCNS